LRQSRTSGGYGPADRSCFNKDVNRYGINAVGYFTAGAELQIKTQGFGSGSTSSAGTFQPAPPQKN